MRCERGYTEQLPDLAVWLKPSGRPVAVIAESGGRREDRQKMILEGWDYAIRSGRYASVHYDCASASVAHWIGRLAKKVRLRPPDFFSGVQMTAEEIAALSPAAEDDAAVDQPQRSAEAAPPREERVEIAPLSTQAPPAPPDVSRPEPPPPRPSRSRASAASAYDAPFAVPGSKAGARIFPRLVPLTARNPAVPANRAAWDALVRWEKPFLTVFSDGDPITRGMDRSLQQHVPGAAGQPHARVHGGHFLQEDAARSWREGSTS